MRKTRTAAVLCIEVGVVLAVTPVYAAVRASQSAGWKLRSVVKRRLPKTVSQGVGRLKSSGEEGRLVKRSQASAPENVEPKVSLSLVRTISSVVSRFAQKVTSIGRANQSIKLQYDKETSSKLDSNSNKLEQGGLVQTKRSFWVALLEAVANLKPRWRAKRLKSAFVALPQTTNSGLSSSQRLSQLNGQSNCQLDSSAPVAILSAQCDRIINLQFVPSPGPNLESKPNTAPADFLEAKVTTSEYIEHPLETALKWIDRVLTWLENYWKTLAKIWSHTRS